jgi:hypothetical protein
VIAVFFPGKLFEQFNKALIISKIALQYSNISLITVSGFVQSSLARYFIPKCSMLKNPALVDLSFISPNYFDL